MSTLKYSELSAASFGGRGWRVWWQLRAYAGSAQTYELGLTTPPLGLERSLSIGITSQFQDENKYLRLAIQQSEAIKRKGGFYKDASKSLQSSKFYFGVKTLKTRASSVSSL
jgi:hypothetical protein